MKTFFETPHCETCQARLNNVFCTLSDQQLQAMSIDKSCGHYKKGQVIFFEGNKPTGMYCINKGKVKVFQTGEEGKEQIIRLAKDGDILGYRSLISGENYGGSASVIEDATVCYVSRQTFFDLLQTNSELSTRMMKLLSHDLKEAEKRITGLAQKPVRERMAETILMLKEFYGLEPDKLTIKAALSREDISNIVGTATETAIRILSDFKTEKLIELSGKKIKVLNIPGLIKAAHIFD